jgi:hypothetical protein
MSMLQSPQKAEAGGFAPTRRAVHMSVSWRGVPLLRAENPAFCAKYDRLIKPLPYEVKLEYMMEPLDFPITRLMKTDQKTRYLDSILKEYSEQGVVLTIPEERY